jgi:hypothetical protein
MIYETDDALEPELQKVGCYAESIAMYNPNITDDQMNKAWDNAKLLKYVDSDLNLVNPQGLINILGYPLTLRIDADDNSHFPGTTPVDPKTMHLIGEWHNPNNGFTHFVVMDGKGLNKQNVKYDPIQGGSKTVTEGNFVSYRIFDVVDVPAPIIPATPLVPVATKKKP